jgi:hypothetical protein
MALLGLPFRYYQRLKRGEEIAALLEVLQSLQSLKETQP